MIHGSKDSADKLCGNRRRYPDVYLASTFSSINNSALVLLPFSPPPPPSLPAPPSRQFYRSSILYLSLSLCVCPTPSLRRIERAHASASLIKRVSIIHAFAKLPLPLQWLPNPLGRVCDRSIKPSRASHPICLLFFKEQPARAVRS